MFDTSQQSRSDATHLPENSTVSFKTSDTSLSYPQYLSKDSESISHSLSSLKLEGSPSPILTNINYNSWSTISKSSSLLSSTDLPTNFEVSSETSTLIPSNFTSPTAELTPFDSSNSGSPAAISKESNSFINSEISLSQAKNKRSPIVNSELNSSIQDKVSVIDHNSNLSTSNRRNLKPQGSKKFETSIRMDSLQDIPTHKYIPPSLSPKTSIEDSPRAHSTEGARKKKLNSKVKRISLIGGFKTDASRIRHRKKDQFNTIAESEEPSEFLKVPLSELDDNSSPKENVDNSIRLKRIGSNDENSYRTFIKSFELLEAQNPDKVSDSTLTNTSTDLKTPASSLDQEKNLYLLKFPDTVKKLSSPSKFSSEPLQHSHDTQNNLEKDSQENISNYFYNAVSSLWTINKPDDISTEQKSYRNSRIQRSPLSNTSRKLYNESDPDSDIDSSDEHASPDAYINLMLERIREQNKQLMNDPKNTNFEKYELKKQLDESRTSMRKSGTDNEVDWEYWGSLISDFDKVVKKDPQKLKFHIQNGIPNEIRGMVWQLFSGSRKDPKIVMEYINLLGKPSPFEKVILRDLNRTYPDHEYFKDQDGPGQTSLNNILNVYSLYDKELGYCQGMGFVVGPLLLNMPEEDAFCVFNRLMQTYGLRGNYLPDMDLLQCRLYQFCKLLERQLPKLSKHFTKHEIKPTMYVSKWFMTLFGCCLPMDLIFRVFDLIFTNGTACLFQLALAVLKRSQAMLLDLDFERLIKVLSNKTLFEFYSSSAGGGSLIHDINSITMVTPRILEKLEKEYLEISKKAEETNRIIETLRNENILLKKEKQGLLGSLKSLTKEHSETTSNYVQTKLDLGMVKEQNTQLLEKIAHLEARLATERSVAEEKMKADMEKLASDNLELVKRCNELDSTTAEVEQALLRVNNLYIETENERFELETKLKDLQRSVQGP
ncbi:hypothetical protein BB560_006989 [Smittium megazygosporum]|uniref:Rab-GAP TBC domain-containing protein n=1 Tax=Smittium megazygosporum TaxID=133381 RepID=A0A2T9XZJ1_9FUNG|nr:hypothetical protein BB560_006989 [Smittium megazygosporum]